MTTMTARFDDLEGMDRFLVQIGEVPLLTADQEVALAQAIERGDLAQAALAHGDSAGDAAMQARLHEDIAHAAAARDQLIRANLRLCVRIARNYVSPSALPLSDLVQEATMGLMRAVQKFDHRTGNRFSTYATWWIRQAVTRALAEKSRTIRLPVHLSGRMTRLRNAQRVLWLTLEREPTVAELAAHLGWSVAQVDYLVSRLPHTTSLEAPFVRDQRDNALAWDAVLADDQDVPGEAETVLLADIVRAAVDALPEREQNMVRLRYGLDGGHPLTLEEVGKRVGCTRERVRQVTDAAFQRLRAADTGMLRSLLKE